MDISNLIKTMATTAITEKLGQSIGLSSDQVKGGLTQGMPALLGGLFQQVSGGSQGASGMADMINQFSKSGFSYSDLTTLLSGGQKTNDFLSMGMTFAKSIFGDKFSQVAGQMSQNGNSDQMQSLLGGAAGILGSFMSKEGPVNPASLLSSLNSNKTLLAGLMPSNMSSLLGLGGLLGGVAAPSAGMKAMFGKWAVPAAIALAAFTWWKNSGTPVAVKEAATTAVASTVETAKKMSEVALPTGEKLNIAEGTVNYKLATFLATKNEAAPKTFVFDNLNFEVGSAKISPDSMETVNNLAAILKAYKGAEIRLDGHTDNTGNPTQNKLLSDARAKAIKTALLEKGIEQNRLSAVGFGDAKPVAENTTDEGKAQNRRTELTVLKQ